MYLWHHPLLHERERNLMNNTFSKGYLSAASACNLQRPYLPTRKKEKENGERARTFLCYSSFTFLDILQSSHLPNQTTDSSLISLSTFDELIAESDWQKSKRTASFFILLYWYNSLRMMLIILSNWEWKNKYHLYSLPIFLETFLILGHVKRKKLVL